uniref:NADH dehydrogenase subunit 6 n=1 Tax=Cryptocelis alba TaxID=2115975 RepID=A0A2R3SK34_9PLAT|nr:NADH dehydrogenase subunit 6 [Cryptocelis alba]
MSSFLWFVLIVANFLSLFFINTLGLAFYIFLASVSICLLMAFHGSIWYALIFFLIYVGGVLVLFIYISSLNFNPVFRNQSIWTGWVGNTIKFQLFFILFSVLLFNPHEGKGTNWIALTSKEYSYDLFLQTETLFLVSVGALLLFVLWAISKLTFRTRASLRPFFDNL